MTFTISQAAALATRENRASQADIDWSSPEVRQNGVDLLRELVAKVRSGELRYIGQGSQGPETAAFQYALMAASGGQQRITIDGIFGSRTSHQSTDLLAAVQNAVGERSTKYQGTGPEAAGINTFVAMHNRMMAADASPLQLGVTPPAVAPGQRQRERTERLAQYDQLAAAPVPAAEPDAERFAPGVAPLVAAPAPITDEASARAAILAVSDAPAEQRAEVLKRLGIAGRAPADGVDNAAVVRGTVAGLTEGDVGTSTRRVADYLGANEGQNNDAVLAALRASPQWPAVRSFAASQSFDGTGVSASTWNILAGPRPAANAPAAEQRDWNLLRLGAVNENIGARQPLSRDDLYVIARAGSPESMRFLTNGSQADAIAAVRARVDELPPDAAAKLIADIHGPATGELTEELQRRRAIAYGVVHGVFDQEGVGDTARYAFFSALAGANNPTLVTMPPAEFTPMWDRVYSSSTGSWFHRGERYVGDIGDDLTTRRRAVHGDPAPATRTRNLRGGGYFPQG